MSKTYLMSMSARRCRWLTGVVSFCGLAVSVAQAAEPTDAQRLAPPAEDRFPVILGVMADAGVPDGAMGALQVRPLDWLRLHLGAGTNTVSLGYRLGATVIPFGWGPSLSLEAGHFRDGNANGLVRSVVGYNDEVKSLFDRVGYTFYNAQLGFELGRGNFQFFIHGGFSFLRATLPGAAEALMKSSANNDPSTTITLRQDPIVRVWTPSVKLGVAYTFGGGR